MSEVYISKEFFRVMKKAQRKKWVKGKVEKVKDWCYDVREWCDDNKEMLIIFGPVVIGAATTIIKVVGKNVNLKKEKNMKDLYCYDRSLGHYWALKRRLKKSEWVEIAKRKNDGESLADILSEMKVLK